MIDQIKINEEYYFSELWDGNGDGTELLESGSISPDNENVVEFVIVMQNPDILDTVVRVTAIY